MWHLSGVQILPFSPFLVCLMFPGNPFKRNEEPAKASRPYEKNRDGMVLSEGGASVVMEELNHAQDRGADIYAEIVSYVIHGRGTRRCSSWTSVDMHWSPHWSMH